MLCTLSAETDEATEQHHGEGEEVQAGKCLRKPLLVACRLESRSSTGLNLASRERDSGAREVAIRPRLWQPPALLALATMLQAYTGVRDDEVMEATVMDRRWQLVLDCLDCEQAPFSRGTLVAFRQRLTERDRTGA
jgi:hypothetical protein